MVIRGEGGRGTRDKGHVALLLPCHVCTSLHSLIPPCTCLFPPPACLMLFVLPAFICTPVLGLNTGNLWVRFSHTIPVL